MQSCRTARGSFRTLTADRNDDGVLGAMPIIAVFFGIIIRMFYREHEPEHFHAEHQGQHGKFDFDGNMTVGNITSKPASS